MIIQAAYDQPSALSSLSKTTLVQTYLVGVDREDNGLAIEPSSPYGSALATFRCRVAAVLRSRSATSPSLTHRWRYFTLPHDLRLPAGHQHSTSEFFGIGGPPRNYVDVI